MAKVSIRALRRDVDRLNDYAMRLQAERDGINQALQSAKSEIARSQKFVAYFEKLADEQAQYIRALRQSLMLGFQLGAKIYEGRYE